MKKFTVKRLAFSMMASVIMALMNMSALADAIDIAFDAGRQAGKDECKANPSSCGITVVDEQTVKDNCQNDPSSCGITVVDEQTVKDACKLDPSSCGITVVDEQTVKDSCQKDPSSCGITVANEQTVEDNCQKNPSSCGIFFSVPSIKKTKIETDFCDENWKEQNEAYAQLCQNEKQRFTALVDWVNQNCSGTDDCGITLKQAGRDECKADPSSCNIITEATPAFIQTVKDECLANPSSCGIGLHIPPLQEIVGSVPPEDCASESAGENCISWTNQKLYLPRVNVVGIGGSESPSLVIEKLGMELFVGNKDLTVFVFVYKLYSLTVPVEGDGNVKRDPKEVSPCAGQEYCFFHGKGHVNLTATENSGAKFDRWVGESEDCHGETPTITITMDSNKTCKAIFVEAATDEMGGGGASDGTTGEDVEGSTSGTAPDEDIPRSDATDDTSVEPKS